MLDLFCWGPHGCALVQDQTFQRSGVHQKDATKGPAALGPPSWAPGPLKIDPGPPGLTNSGPATLGVCDEVPQARDSRKINEPCKAKGGPSKIRYKTAEIHENKHET